MLGLGLIGGSVARAAIGAGMTVRAWTPAGAGPRLAVDDGIAPAASPDEAVDGADLVVLAAPPLATLDLIDELGAAARLAPDVVVTDVTSTKVAIVDRARAAGLRFVGGHPLAGRETTGYAASEPDLFVDRPWVIVPPDPPDTDAETRVETLVAACGARPVRMSAVAHDRAVAAISHLPLLVAAALTETVAGSADWEVARGLAAGGWASMTRLARGDAGMGAGILATNHAEVAARLRELVATLDAWGADLERADADTLRDRLAAARTALGQSG